MNTKIVLVLTVVALSISYCEGLTNVYGDEYGEVFENEKVNRRLTEDSAMNAREVAELLVKAINKEQALEATKGVKILNLLTLASPFDHCYLGDFADFEEWRKLFSGPNGNVHLLNFVNENTERIFNECAGDIDRVFNSASDIWSYEGGYSDQMTKYATTTGEESDSQDVIVKGFLAAKILKEWDEQKLIKECAALEPHVKEALSFFIKDDKKVSDYLDNLGDTKQALLYKRCKAVNQMFGKQ